MRSVPATTSLRRDNLIAGAAHTVSGFLIIGLANTSDLPITAHYMTGTPGTTARQLVTLGAVRVAWLVVTFLWLSAVAHLLLAGPLRSRYECELATGRTPFRWIEYSLSSSLMIVVIA